MTRAVHDRAVVAAPVVDMVTAAGMPPGRVLDELGGTDEGLSSADAAERLARFGQTSSSRTVSAPSTSWQVK